MVTYIEPPIVTDVDAIIADALDYLTANIPGYVPQEGHLEVWLIQAIARITSTARDTGSRVPTAIFKYYGQSLLGIVPIDPTAAVATTTWTMNDDAGYTIPAGTVIGYRTAGDVLVPFKTTEAVTIAPGDTTTETGAVLIQAIEEGASGNDLGPSSIELIDALSYVSGITAVGVTGGGADGETDDEYLARLVDELSLFAPRPILPHDFALLARRVSGVHRAVAVDGYNPDNDSTDNERMIAVAVIDRYGVALTTEIKDEVEALLESMREVNFVVNVIDPEFTAVDIDFTVIAFPGYSATTVHDAAVDALAKYLDAATWGVDPGDTLQLSWTNETDVRYLEVASVLNAVPGVRYVSALTLDSGTADVTLDGVVTLPTAGSITGSVT